MKKLLKWAALSILAVFALLILFVATSYHADIPVADLEPKYFTAESAYIELNGTRVHIRQRGAGQPIILIHGSFASLHTWDAWESELSTRYRTISLDLPGHGLTGPSETRQYSASAYADIIVQLIDNLDLKTVYLIGNSMGGGVALTVAARHPEKVLGLILLDSSGPPIQLGAAETQRQQRPLIFRVLSIRWLANSLTSLTPRWLFAWNMKQVYADPSRIKDETINRYYDLMLREGNRQATFERIQQAAGRGLPADSLSFINTPTLIVWGEQDRWIPRSYGEKLNKAISGSTLVILPALGHVPMEEDPLRSIQPVTSFLSELQR